ncbi:MAG: hypothetical protein ABI268_02065 [Rhodanobacter sp.]
MRLGSHVNVLLEDGGNGTLLCMVGRELCLYMALDARKAPSKQRADFTRLAVRRAAPFPDPEFDVAWTADGMAAIWYWSHARVSALVDAESPLRKRFVAEAVYAGQPQQESIELLQLAGCVEARIWRSGKLIATRWWPESPAQEPWAEFLQGVGQTSHDSPVPTPIPTSLAHSPWTRKASTAVTLQGMALGQYLPRIAMAVGILFLLGVGAESGEIARYQLEAWRARSAATGLDAPLQRILDAREASDKALTDITSLLALRSPRAPISLMAELSRSMPDDNWRLKKWNQPTPDTIEVSIIAPGSNPEKLVSTLEASTMFKGVTTELGSDNEVVIKATVRPPADMPEAPAP